VETTRQQQQQGALRCDAVPVGDSTATAVAATPTK